MRGDSENISIEVRYDSRFIDAVRGGNPDPMIGMKIVVDGEYVFGGEAPDRVASDYMCSNFIAQLEAVEDIVGGKKKIIEYANGPVFLVFEPNNDQSIFITGCHTYEGAHDPDARIPEDTRKLVSKKQWISELVRTAEQYHEKALNQNPNLAESDGITMLEEALDEVEKRFPDYID